VAHAARCFAGSFWDLQAANAKLQAQARTAAMLKCRTRVTSFQFMASIHGMRDIYLASALFLSRWKNRNNRLTAAVVNRLKFHPFRPVSSRHAAC
jgi:hypothetical protein